MPSSEIIAAWEKVKDLKTWENYFVRTPCVKSSKRGKRVDDSSLT